MAKQSLIVILSSLLFAAFVEAEPLKKVHVFVALCDNENQGIVPTTKTLGDGRNPRTNLYWGAMYGLETFFRKSSEWSSVKVNAAPKRDGILDSCAFCGHGVLLYAEAYDGSKMAMAINEFLLAAAGSNRHIVELGSYGKVSFGAEADLICFVGHNGLMDFSLRELPRVGKTKPSGAVVLACKSHDYFSPLLQALGCRPLLMTNGFMAPEAYTVAALVKTWATGGKSSDVHEAAAQAYAKYQKHCSIEAARRLFRVPKSKIPRSRTEGL